jgi:hypothetical protein
LVEAGLRAGWVQSSDADKLGLKLHVMLAKLFGSDAGRGENTHL